MRSGAGARRPPRGSSRAGGRKRHARSAVRGSGTPRVRARTPARRRCRARGRAPAAVPRRARSTRPSTPAGRCSTPPTRCRTAPRAAGGRTAESRGAASRAPDQTCVTARSMDRSATSARPARWVVTSTIRPSAASSPQPSPSRLAIRVLRRCRFVEQQQPPVASEQAMDRPRGRDPLRLTARESRTPPGRACDPGRARRRQGRARGREGRDRRPRRPVARSSRSCRPGAPASVPPTRSTTDRRDSMRWPSSAMLPEASAKPSSAANRLDLPEPLSPVIATSSPERASSRNPSSTTRSPRRSLSRSITSPSVESRSVAEAGSSRAADSIGHPAPAPRRAGRTLRSTRHPGGRRVEGGADVAQRQEHLGCEHEHEQPGNERHVARRPAAARSTRRRARPRGSRRTRA